MVYEFKKKGYDRELGKRKTSQVVLSHITIGLQLAITILLFVIGGHELDKRYLTSPLFVAVGAVVGMVLGFYYFMKQIKDEEDRTEKDKKDDGRPGAKWM